MFMFLAKFSSLLFFYLLGSKLCQVKEHIKYAFGFIYFEFGDFFMVKFNCELPSAVFLYVNVTDVFFDLL